MHAKNSELRAEAVWSSAASAEAPGGDVAGGQYEPQGAQAAAQHLLRLRLHAGRDRGQPCPVPDRVAVEDGSHRHVGEARLAKELAEAPGGEELQVLDVEDGRMAAKQLCRGGPPVVADDEQGAPVLEE